MAFHVGHGVAGRTQEHALPRLKCRGFRLCCPCWLCCSSDLYILLMGRSASSRGALLSLSRQGRKEGLTTSRGAWETAPPQITRHGSAFGLILALSPTSSKLNSFSFSRHAMMSSQESRYVQHHWSLAWLPLPLPPCVARPFSLIKVFALYMRACHFTAE